MLRNVGKDEAASLCYLDYYSPGSLCFVVVERAAALEGKQPSERTLYSSERIRGRRRNLAILAPLVRDVESIARDSSESPC